VQDLCASYPPTFDGFLEDVGPCVLPDGHGNNETTHIGLKESTGEYISWDSWECAYPENCQYDGDGDCCITYGVVQDPSSPQQS
jgi:hypothetical protein